VLPSVASAATLAALEFPGLLALVADFAATDLGRAEVGALLPLADPDELRQRRAALEEVIRLAAAGTGLPPAVGEQPGAALAGLASAELAVSGSQILALAELVRGSHVAAERILAADPPCPTLALRPLACPTPARCSLRSPGSSIGAARCETTPARACPVCGGRCCGCASRSTAS